MLESVNRGLKERGITLHLSEVKLPVRALLDNADFLANLSGCLNFELLAGGFSH